MLTAISPGDFCGPDPLWRDVLNTHQTRPFHVMIGGGDQIYNDVVTKQSPLLREWLGIKNPIHKQETSFSPQLLEELETVYLERYSMWFSQGFFGMANSQIPMVNVWDDHGKIPVTVHSPCFPLMYPDPHMKSNNWDLVLVQASEFLLRLSLVITLTHAL